MHGNFNGFYNLATFYSSYNGHMTDMSHALTIQTVTNKSHSYVLIYNYVL